MLNRRLANFTLNREIIIYSYIGFDFVALTIRGKIVKYLHCQEQHQQRCNYCLDVLIHDSLYFVSVVHFPGGSEEVLLPLLPPCPAAVAEGC